MTTTPTERHQAEQLIAAVDAVYHGPTSYRDETEPPKYGDAPPVLQPDKRIVPAWAAGIAVASIGVGAGVTGLGCGAWLVLKGLASVTLNSVLMVTLPIAAAAMLVTAIGVAISRVRSAVTTNIYKGPVHQKNIHSRRAKTINQQ
jgi:hypothetical protein